MVLPLVALVALAGAAYGLYLGIDTRLKLRRAANEYAAKYPGFTVTNGIVTVDNDDKVHFIDGELKTGDFQKRISIDPLRVDANSIRKFDRQWATWLMLGAPFVMAAVNLVSEAFGVLFVVAVSALIAWSARGRGLYLDYWACFRVALAAYSALVVLELLLGFVGLAPGACWGLVVWNVILSLLTAWRLGHD